MIVGIIRRKPVLTHASIVCEGMLASVNLVNTSDQFGAITRMGPQFNPTCVKCLQQTAYEAMGNLQNANCDSAKGYFAKFHAKCSVIGRTEDN